MKIRVRDDHCKGCLWLSNSGLCAFQRCVKRYGFSADKKKGRRFNETKRN